MSARVLRALGLPSVRGQVPLVVALAVDAIGTGCGGPLMLPVLTWVVDLAITTAGAMLTIASVAALAVPALVGAVVDRVGARRVVIAALILQAVGTYSYLVCPEWCRERDLPLADCSPASPRLSTTIRSTSSQPAIAATPQPISPRLHTRVDLVRSLQQAPAAWILGDLLDVGSRV